MKTNLILSAFLLTGLVACAEKHHAGLDKPSTEAKQAAIKEEASYVTEFTFPKGSANLSDAAKADLRRVIDQAKVNGDIEEVKVITWGDAEYPSTREKKLSSQEIDLVKRRNNAIRDYLKTVSRGIDVDSHSMAERPGALRELFNTSDVRIKRSLETAGIPTTDSNVKAPSKASKSIIMVLRQ